MNEAVAITGIAAGGDGVGRLADGCAVFVPRTAPGDRVALDPARLERRRRFARGAVAEVLAPGPDRVAPACPHYDRDRCSGCQLQHLSYDAQLAVKRRIVGDTLRRIGKLDIEDPPIEEALEEHRYRAKITLAVGRAPGRDGAVIGFAPYDAPGRVFALADCHIADVRLMAAWRAIKSHAVLLPPRLARLTLRLDREGRCHVVCESSGEPWAAAADLRTTLGAAGMDVVCWWQPTDGAARVMAGPATGFPATAFEHVNPEMGAIARRWAADSLGDVAGRAVWDLYGGIGDTAVLLAERGADVVSVDADESAVAWARGRAVARPVRWIASRAEDIIARLPEAAGAVVNPPRTGLHWDVTLHLTQARVPRVAYVSCDPATLARDLYRLAATYRVAAIKAFDLFPQTADVETVAVLEAA